MEVKDGEFTDGLENDIIVNNIVKVNIYIMGLLEYFYQAFLLHKAVSFMVKYCCILQKSHKDNVFSRSSSQAFSRQQNVTTRPSWPWKGVFSTRCAEGARTSPVTGSAPAPQ